MKEPPKHITEQQCSNCTHFQSLYMDELFDGTCNSENQIYSLVVYGDYCIFHERDENKKNQKKGRL